MRHAKPRWRGVLLRLRQSVNPPSSNAQRPVAARPVSGAAYAPKKSNKLKIIIPAVAAVIVIAVVAFFALSPAKGTAGGTIKGGTGASGAVQVGDTVTFGTYEQDNNTSNGKEAIEWQVLDVQDGKALLISKYGLDYQPYHTQDAEITWETCSLRTWLNSDFYAAAFSTDEQSKMASTTLTNEDNSECKTKGGNATTDKVFCLSISEANKYFDSASARICTPTTYAIAQGAHKYSDTNGCYWRLRSPGGNQTCSACVYDDGQIHLSGYGVENAAVIRPALWVNL